MKKTVGAKTQLFGALCASFLLLGIGATGQARAEPVAPKVVQKRQTQTAQPPRISAGEAANIAQSATAANVLAVKFRRGHYRVKLLRSNGVIIMVKVDANTGRVSR